MLLGTKTSLPSALADGFKAPLLKKGGVGGGCISGRSISKKHSRLLQRKFFKIESFNPLILQILIQTKILKSLNLTNPNSDKFDQQCLRTSHNLPLQAHAPHSNNCPENPKVLKILIKKAADLALGWGQLTTASPRSLRKRLRASTV